MGLFDIFRRKKKEPEPEPVEPVHYEPPSPPDWLVFQHNTGFEGDAVRITVKVTNTSDEFIGKPVLRILASEALFEIDKDEVSAEELNGGESMEAVFHLRAKREMNRYEPKVEFEYFDFSVKERVAYRIAVDEIVYEDEVTLGKYSMDDDEFRVYIVRLSPLEIETDEMEIGGKACHDAVMKRLQMLHFHIVDPVMVAPEIFRSIIKLGAKDHEGEIYAVEIQIVGNSSMSKMLIRIWSRNGKHILGVKNHIINELNRAIPLKIALAS